MPNTPPLCELPRTYARHCVWAMVFVCPFCRDDEAAALYLRCAEAWVHADEPGRAADYFGRSAKLVKDTDEDAAAERYIFASKVRRTIYGLRYYGRSYCGVQGETDHGLRYYGRNYCSTYRTP